MSYQEISNNFVNIFKKTGNDNDYAKNFIRSGLPNNKFDESWKHSPVSLFPLTPSFSKIQAVTTNLNSTKEIKTEATDGVYKISFFNNSLLLDSSSIPSGLKIETASQIANISIFNTASDPIVNLTKGNCEKEINIIATENINKPILFDFNFDSKIEEQKWSSLILNFTLDENIHLNLITRSTGMIDSVSTIFNFNLKEKSALHHLNLINTTSRYFGNNFYQLERNSNLNSFSISNSNKISRQNIEVILNGENSMASLNGLFETKNKNHCDIYTVMRHNCHHTISSQLFKGIAHDTSRSIYNGRVIIAKDCHNSQSSQLSRNIIKNKTARIYSRPQLEVYNDDVSCSHGSTFGQLSEDELFYLISRGINQKKAEQMLQSAFYNDAINTIESKDLRNFAQDYINNDDE